MRIRSEYLLSLDSGEISLDICQDPGAVDNGDQGGTNTNLTLNQTQAVSLQSGSDTSTCQEIEIKMGNHFS